MTAAVRRVSLDEALPGMILAEDACSGSSVLLACGTLLTEAHLAGLRNRGVAGISVIAPPEAQPGAAAADLEEARDAARRRVAHLFRRSGDDPVNQALQRAVLEYRLERLK